jgi:hypothetical protein
VIVADVAEAFEALDADVTLYLRMRAECDSGSQLPSMAEWEAMRRIAKTVRRLNPDVLFRAMDEAV